MSSIQIPELMTPVALVDHKKLCVNIDRMAKKAKENNVALRPHVKTHKCTEIGRLQIESGAQGITVATLREATVFARTGFDDIIYAVPLSRNKISVALDLASDISLKVLVDNPSIVDELAMASRKVGVDIDVMVKIDCGYHRCGVDPRSTTSINLVRRITDASHLRFKGILTHAGHSYLARSKEEIKQIAEEEQQVMVKFSKTLRRENLVPEIVSIGSTPTTAVADSFDQEITEIRPGNYVFHDYTQVALGICSVSDCALSILASVVGSYPDRIIIDAGATALSKDQGPRHIEPGCGFGRVIADYDNGILKEGVNIDSLSQEHGKITLSANVAAEFHPSDMIRILPNHSCLTANLFSHYVVVDDERVIARWKTM